MNNARQKKASAARGHRVARFSVSPTRNEWYADIQDKTNRSILNPGEIAFEIKWPAPGQVCRAVSTHPVFASLDHPLYCVKRVEDERLEPSLRAAKRGMDERSNVRVSQNAVHNV